jgi:two-component system chemotaxis response regulator CheV
MYRFIDVSLYSLIFLADNPLMATGTPPAITGDILLDAGTNELEVLVFHVRGGSYGVNVAKVREVIKPLPMTATPHQHTSIIGMFNIRGNVLPVVDLAKHLGLAEKSDPASGRVIITEFNGLRTGFLVDGVDQIHRMSWSKVRPAPEVGETGSGGVSSVTGVVELKDSLVLMLDFESVADAILVERRLHVDKVDNPTGVDRARKRVVLAEDSPFMRNLMREVFINSGYARLEVCSDGEQAWKLVSGATEVDPIHCIVSDIEMPRMDGLFLCKNIKQHAALRDVPVILFSSLISQDNLKKGQQVGADMQVAKPELAEMVRLVDRAVTGTLKQSLKAAA